MIVIPSRMGRLNERALLACLQRKGLASRADLAKALGLSQPTAGKIVDELLNQGVLEEVEAGKRGAVETPGKLGRPGRLLQLNHATPRFLAVQLGVQETRMTVLPVGAKPDDRWIERFRTPSSAATWVNCLSQTARKLRSDTLWGVLVSVPGIVDEHEGDVVFSPNLHWTERSRLASMIQEAVKLPAALVQEERALALGHQYVEPENRNFMLVDFGEGVGGAMILDGKLFAPPLPISGEFGHTPVAGNNRACGCGAKGCLETLISRRGLLQSFDQQKPKDTATWAALVRSVATAGLAPWLIATLNSAAVIIAGALNVLGLRKVVITGCLNELPPAVLNQFSDSIRQGCLWARFGELEVVCAPRRRTAGLVAVGIDRLVLPMSGSPGDKPPAPTLLSQRGLSPTFPSPQP